MSVFTKSHQVSDGLKLNLQQFGAQLLGHVGNDLHVVAGQGGVGLPGHSSNRLDHLRLDLRPELLQHHGDELDLGVGEVWNQLLGDFLDQLKLFLRDFGSLEERWLGFFEVMGSNLGGAVFFENLRFKFVLCESTRKRIRRRKSPPPKMLCLGDNVA